MDPYNIQQFVCNRLLTTLIVLLRQILDQLVCVVRSHLHSQRTCSMSPEALESTAAVKSSACTQWDYISMGLILCVRFDDIIIGNALYLLFILSVLHYDVRQINGRYVSRRRIAISLI